MTVYEVEGSVGMHFNRQTTDKQQTINKEQTEKELGEFMLNDDENICVKMKKENFRKHRQKQQCKRKENFRITTHNNKNHSVSITTFTTNLEDLQHTCKYKGGLRGSTEFEYLAAWQV
jgi:hypothetical protein